MECSQLAMAFRDEDMKLIPFPPSGIDYERLPSPPPSEHSSQDDEDDKKEDDGDKTNRKKLKMRPEDYLRIRNENVANYLRKLKKNPPPSYEADLAKLVKEREDHLRFVKGRATKPEVVQEEVHEDSDCSSETSWETDILYPRNMEKVRQLDFQVQCFQDMVDQRKELAKNDSGASACGVLFSHVNFQMIAEANWLLIKMKRLEQILEGVELGCKVDPKWLDFEAEIQKCYGPMDTESSHFEKLVEAFQMQREEMIAKMFGEEREMIERMAKQTKVPSDLPQQLEMLRQTRSRLETRIAAMSEFQCDQNPYTNPDNMDFWVVPRPNQTIEVYDIRNEETDKFLENNLPLDGKGVPELVGSTDQNKLLVRKGYNAAVFDVGWHYTSIKAFWDILRDCLLNVHSGNCSHSLNETKWKRRLLELREKLMEFNPFGVNRSVFYRHTFNRDWWLEDTVIFFSLGEEDNGYDRLVDLYYPQTLLSSGREENKVIAFDSLLEGVIVPPVEMLQRVWERIKFLIDEQPNHLLPLNEFQQIYETCFGQKFFPLQWGFKDVEDFFENVHQYLPKEMAQEVTIVTRDKDELEKIDAAKVRKKAIDAKWANILEDDEDYSDVAELFDLEDLFGELIHEGPWLNEGDVYRVLPD